MTLSNLLVDLKEFGFRFAVVEMLPSLMLTLFLLCLVVSGAPGTAPDLQRIVATSTDEESTKLVYLAIGLVAAGMVLHPLQLSLVRLLEGYWGGSWLGRKLFRWGSARHERSVQELMAQVVLPEAAHDQIPPEKWAESQRAAWTLNHCYPQNPQLLMPTALGNVLRAAEERPSLLYGLDAVTFWPRLYLLLPDRVIALLSDLRLQLDFAARFCGTLIIAALAGALMLMRHGWWNLLPATLLALAWVAYRATVAAALAYGQAVHAAIDLHRFDLMQALHLPLPPDLQAERKQNATLKKILVELAPDPLEYKHPEKAPAPETKDDGGS